MVKTSPRALTQGVRSQRIGPWQQIPQRLDREPAAISRPHNFMAGTIHQLPPLVRGWTICRILHICPSRSQRISRVRNILHRWDMPYLHWRATLLRSEFYIGVGEQSRPLETGQCFPSNGQIFRYPAHPDDAGRSETFELSRRCFMPRGLLVLLPSTSVGIDASLFLNSPSVLDEPRSARAEFSSTPFQSRSSAAHFPRIRCGVEFCNWPEFAGNG
jgi:hypothetical protein